MSITDLVNILLPGDLSREVNEIIFGSRLIALEKKGLDQFPLDTLGEDLWLNVLTDT